jgi:hypothetical protein
MCGYPDRARALCGGTGDKINADTPDRGWITGAHPAQKNRLPVAVRYTTPLPTVRRQSYSDNHRRTVVLARDYDTVCDGCQQNRSKRSMQTNATCGILQMGGPCYQWTPDGAALYVGTHIWMREGRCHLPPNVSHLLMSSPPLSPYSGVCRQRSKRALAVSGVTARRYGLRGTRYAAPSAGLCPRDRMGTVRDTVTRDTQ